MSSKKIDIQGHRGARGLYPENTLTAFTEALKIGVNTLELDVVISRDEQVVVSHEPWMSDVICSKPDGTPVEKDSRNKHNLFRLKYAEIRRYDSGKRGHPGFPQQKAMPEHKPLLKEVIEMAEKHCREHKRPAVHYNIETKSVEELDRKFNPDPRTFTRLLYNILKKLHVLERVTIQSFDIRTLRELHKMDDSVKTSLLVENNDSVDVNIQRLGFRPDIYSPDYTLLDQEAVDHLHNLGVLVLPWTINEPEDMKKLVDMGIDGFITDYPDRAVKLFNPQAAATPSV